MFQKRKTDTENKDQVNMRAKGFTKLRPAQQKELVGWIQLEIQILGHSETDILEEKSLRCFWERMFSKVQQGGFDMKLMHAIVQSAIKVAKSPNAYAELELACAEAA